jgi:iron-sulfur cluster assembly accessory protein
MSGELTITDRAAEKIRALLVGAKAGHGLRVRVVEGGCSGFEYKMGIDSPGTEDQVFENTGARILLDSKSMLHLNGTELDYRSGLMQAGFVFNNPNVKATCGCGTSFSA